MRGIAGAGRTRMWALLLGLATVLLPVSTAQAAAPAFDSVTADFVMNASWTVPAGMKTYSIEVATSPETYPDGDSKGSFLTENWAQSAILFTSGATQFTSQRLPTGRYYVHVSAVDLTTCASPLAIGCPKEWSETVAFDIPRRPFGVTVSPPLVRRPVVTWSLPTGSDIHFIEVATAPDVYRDGPAEGLFLDENVVLAQPLTNVSSHTLTRPLAGGSYYVHIGFLDPANCVTPNALCREEISSPVQFTVRANPPVLTSAGHSNGVLALTWALPGGLQSDFVEVATSPDVYTNGPLRGGFRDENLVYFDDSLNPDDLEYTAPEALPRGIYYAHVAALVAGSCTAAGPLPGCFDEYTDTVRIAIPSEADFLPKPPPAQAAQVPDRVTRFARLRARRVQSARRLSVLAVMDEDGSVRVTGSLRLPGAARTLKLKPVTRSTKAHVPVTLRLRLTKAALRAVRRAISRRQSVTARLTITARDRANNADTERRTIRLKR